MLTGSGHSVAEIAALLGLSPLTVENLKRRVYAKLDVSSSVHAVAKAASLGMLDPPTTPLRAVRPPAEKRRRPPADGESAVLPVVAGQYCSALDQVVAALVSSPLPFVLVRRPGPVADTHWARWHRGPIVAVLVDPGAAGLGPGRGARRAGHPGAQQAARPARTSPRRWPAGPARWCRRTGSTTTSCRCCAWSARATWSSTLCRCGR